MFDGYLNLDWRQQAQEKNDNHREYYSNYIRQVKSRTSQASVWMLWL